MCRVKCLLIEILSADVMSKYLLAKAEHQCPCATCICWAVAAVSALREGRSHGEVGLLPLAVGLMDPQRRRSSMLFLTPCLSSYTGMAPSPGPTRWWNTLLLDIPTTLQASEAPSYLGPTSFWEGIEGEWHGRTQHPRGSCSFRRPRHWQKLRPCLRFEVISQSARGFFTRLGHRNALVGIWLSTVIYPFPWLVWGWMAVHAGQAF